VERRKSSRADRGARRVNGACREAAAIRTRGGGGGCRIAHRNDRLAELRRRRGRRPRDERCQHRMLRQLAIGNRELGVEHAQLRRWLWDPVRPTAMLLLAAEGRKWRPPKTRS